MLDDLLLLRLLCARSAKGGATRSEVSGDLLPAAGDPGEGAARWRDTFTAAVDRLAEAGALVIEGRNGSRLRLTQDGERRAREVFQVPTNYVPSKPGWMHWRDRFALPKALGTKTPLDASGLRAFMLLRFYLPEVDSQAAGGLLKAVDLLLAKKIATKATPAALRVAALRSWASGRREFPPNEVAALASDGSNLNTAKPLPTDLIAFATLVRGAAHASETGRFGDNKVFISHVWRKLAAAGQFGPGQEREFKNLLVRANTAGLLRLSHADLADIHEADDVAASEARYLSERFHFIQLD